METPAPPQACEAAALQEKMQLSAGGSGLQAVRSVSLVNAMRNEDALPHPRLG